MRDRQSHIPNEEMDKIDKEGRQRRIVDYLVASQALEEQEGGRVIVDPEKLREVWKKHEDSIVQESSFQDLIGILHKLKGVSKSDRVASTETEGVSDRPVLALPENIYSLGADYPAQAKNSIVNVWDVKAKTSWNQEVVLPSGEISNPAEMFIATKLKKWNAHRTAQGELVIRDPEQNKDIPFSAESFVRLTGKRVSVTENKQTISLMGNPSLFAARFLSNLDRLGLLRSGDLRTSRGSVSAEIIGMKEKRLNPKAPIITITGDQLSARYYLGRDKIVGTSHPINPETMTVAKLDDNTAAIIEQSHGKKRILYIINLLSDEQIIERRKAVEAKYQKTERRLSMAELAARTTVAGPEMAKRVTDYDITRFLPKRLDQSTVQYAKRLAQLNDPNFVLDKFRKFFAEAGVGTQKLPWAEQLVLADAVLEEGNKDRLVAFAKKYGIEGIRTFLSVDYDPQMAGVVLKLGEKSPEIAGLIFRKYNEIVDAAKEVEQFIASSFGNEAGDKSRVIDRVKDNLLRRGKDLIVQYSKKDATSDVIEKELENVKAGVLLYAATFKSLRKEGQKIDLEDLAGAELIVTEGLQPEDIPQMREIYARNYTHVPEFQKELLTNYDQATSKDQGNGYGHGNNTWYVLKVDSQIKAFNRFQSIGEDREGVTHVEFGFFNVDPDYQGFQIGEAMMERSLDREAKSAIIEATCTATDEIATRYIQRGFVGTGFVPDYKGIADLSIERDDRKNREFKSKFTPQEEIVRLLGRGVKKDLNIDGKKVRVFLSEKPEALPFDLTNQGWLLTQYFHRDNKYYLVLEEAEQDNEASEVSENAA